MVYPPYDPLTGIELKPCSRRRVHFVGLITSVDFSQKLLQIVKHHVCDSISLSWRHVAAAADQEAGKRLSVVLMAVMRSSSTLPLLRMLHDRYTQASILGIPS